MPDSEDPKQLLRNQIADWKTRKARGEEEVRVATEVLPALEQSLSRLEAASPDTESPPPAPAQVEADHGGDAGPNEAPGQGSLTGADEITRGVELVLPGLPPQFTGTEVAAALGKTVNRSSLRSVLQLMAGIGKSFVVETTGKGRRATVYRKL